MTIGAGLRGALSFIDPTGQIKSDAQLAREREARLGRLTLPSATDVRPGLLQALGQDDQRAALDLAAAAARGEAPSLANLQLQEGLQRNVANQFALANTAGSPLALRQAMQNAALGGAQLNQQQAQLRALEQERARQFFGQLASQRRGQTLQGVLGIDRAQMQAAAAAEAAAREDEQRGQDFIGKLGEGAATAAGL